MTPNFPRTQGNMILFYDVKDCKRKNGGMFRTRGKIIQKRDCKTKYHF